MTTEDKIYRDLQKYLDRLPVSYPATESGVELRILKHLFTPEEAKIAMHLSMQPEPLERIHRRVKKTGISRETLRQTLDQMVLKGIVMPAKKGDEPHYSNIHLAVGMYEFQVERLTEDFVKDMFQYEEEAFDDAFYETNIPQLRTIPVEKSIPAPEKYQVSSFDKIRELIENSDGQFGVANCICRQANDLIGKTCTVTNLRETCLLTSSYVAEYYVRMGIGRFITKEEALDILDKVQEAGLVLQPINSQCPEVICCCCGDCCGVLKAVKKLPRPADYYASNFYAQVDPELCSGCETCVSQCQLEAAVVTDNVCSINLDRCIGCGNCVVTCESNAIQLLKKDQEQSPPKDMNDMYTKILMKKVGKWNMLKIGAKMMFKAKI